MVDALGCRETHQGQNHHCIYSSSGLKLLKAVITMYQFISFEANLNAGWSEHLMKVHDV